MLSTNWKLFLKKVVNSYHARRSGGQQQVTHTFSILFMARAGLPSSFYTKFLVGVTCGGFRDWIPIVNPFSIIEKHQGATSLGKQLA